MISTLRGWSAHCCFPYLTLTHNYYQGRTLPPSLMPTKPSEFPDTVMGRVPGILTLARLDRLSVYLWVLPMFHACGWTYPWSNTFAFSTQVSHPSFRSTLAYGYTYIQLIIRNVDYDTIWNHIINSNVTHYCAAPTVQVKSYHQHVKSVIDNPSWRSVLSTRPKTES